MSTVQKHLADNHQEPSPADGLIKSSVKIEVQTSKTLLNAAVTFQSNGQNALLRFEDVTYGQTECKASGSAQKVLDRILKDQPGYEILIIGNKKLDRQLHRLRDILAGGVSALNNSPIAMFVKNTIGDAH